MTGVINQQSIIDILGLADLPEERKQELIREATELVETRLAVRVVESLPAEHLHEFETLTDSGTDQQVAEFLMAKVPELKAWVEEEVVKLRVELAEKIGRLD